jgi:fucose permease
MKKSNRILMLTLIMAFWFTISFITNILGPLIPDIIKNFHLERLAMASFIPTSFFLAYGVMSIPAGIMIEKFGEKPVLFTGFLLPFIGSVLFALFPSFPMLTCSSFIIGLGMAMLQTVINPLQRVVGGEENYAFVAELGQFVFGAASFVSPLVYSYLIQSLSAENYVHGENAFLDLMAGITPPDLRWTSLYWLFTGILLVMLLLVGFVKFPKVELTEDEKSGGKSSYAELFKKKFVWMFFFGIFAYVSIEQGISLNISSFLERYHGIDPQVEGAKCVSGFWGLMTIGCIVGLILLKLIDSRKILIGSGFLSLALLGTALFGPAKVALFAFPAIGFSISVMYSIVYSLALNTVSSHHGSFAGILCTGIVGGAFSPMLIGLVSDATSLKVGVSLVSIFICYIIFIGFTAKPLINNKTVSLRQLFTKSK